MTYEQMVSLLSDKNSSAEAVGRSFFSSQTETRDKKKLLEYLLDEKRYSQLIRLIYSGCINGNISMKKTSADYVAMTGGVSTIHTRYFSLFVQIALDCGIGESKFIPMFFSAAISDKKSELYIWKESSRWYLAKLAAVDYNKAWNYIKKNDPDFRLVYMLLDVDKERVLRDLIELAMFGKGVNKVAIRNFLRGYKSEVLAVVRPMYSGLKNDGKIAAVRLLLLFKNDSEVGRFLGELAETEKSQSVRKLLAGKVSRGFDLGDKTDKRHITEFFYNAMITGVSFTPDDFMQRLILPPFAEIADSLFFGIYRDGALQNIIVVDAERVLNIENEPCIPPPDSEIKVLHASELTYKTEFLKRLNIVQPFEQIKRKVYLPSGSDNSNNACFGISGTVVSAGAFKISMRKIGFRALNKDNDGGCGQVGLCRNGVLCVVNIAPIDLATVDADYAVQAQCVRFYREKDVVRLGGKQFVEGVMPLTPGKMDSRMFSEFMYSAYELMGCK